MDLVTWQALVVSHVVFAAFFVGGNVFMDFILTPRLELIPPGQAARLGEKMGNDFAIYNWVCLGGLLGTGLGLASWNDFAGSLFDPSFLGTSAGVALLVKEIAWGSLVFTGAAMTFYLRPRVIVKLPLGATREHIDASRTDTVRYATWMRRLARYNAAAGLTALIFGVLMTRGGLW